MEEFREKAIRRKPKYQRPEVYNPYTGLSVQTIEEILNDIPDDPERKRVMKILSEEQRAEIREGYWANKGDHSLVQKTLEEVDREDSRSDAQSPYGR